MTDRTRDICTECGEEKMVWMIRDEIWLCDDCAEDQGWTQCAICGDFYMLDEVDFTELPDGREVCEYCMEDYPDNDPEQ